MLSETKLTTMWSKMNWMLYEKFSNEKLYPLGTKLSWSHYRELISIKK